jgi:hypothetical protein
LRQIGRFLEAVYNRKRIHPALGYLTPEEFEQQWHKQRAGGGRAGLVGAVTCPFSAMLSPSLPLPGLGPYEGRAAGGREKAWR